MQSLYATISQCLPDGITVDLEIERGRPTTAVPSLNSVPVVWGTLEGEED